MTMLAEIGTYLDAQLATLTIGTNLFLGQLPESPNTATALFHSPSGRPDFTMGAVDGTAQLPQFEWHRLQVVSRAANTATSYTDAETLIWSIYRQLSLTNVTMTGVRYLLIEPVAVPAPLEEDKGGRISFVANFDVARTPGSASGQ